MAAVIRRFISRALWRTSGTLVRRGQSTNLVKKVLGCAPLFLTIAKCEGAVEIMETKRENLTSEQCIKQACLLSVNSASTLLTTTSAALLDICKEYKDSLLKILNLLDELQNVKGMGAEGENLALWDEIVEARAVLNKAKASVTELQGYMTTVEKVINSTTEAAFLVGEEYMCTTLCERLYSAQKEIGNQIEQLKQLEEEYIKVQREIVLAKEKEVKETPKDTSPLGANTSGLIQIPIFEVHMENQVE